MINKGFIDVFKSLPNSIYSAGLFTNVLPNGFKEIQQADITSKYPMAILLNEGLNEFMEEVNETQNQEWEQAITKLFDELEGR